MTTCKECKFADGLDSYDSGHCRRFPPIPVYQRVEWQYGEPVMGVLSEYPVVYKTSGACGEFQSKDCAFVKRGDTLYHGEKVVGI